MSVGQATWSFGTLSASSSPRARGRVLSCMRCSVSPELVRPVLTEAGGEVHRHAALLARIEEGVVLHGRLGVGRASPNSHEFFYDLRPATSR